MSTLQWASFAFTCGLWLGYYIPQFLVWLDVKYTNKIHREYEKHIKANESTEHRIKYRKKPIEIEAFQFGVECIPYWFMEKAVTGEVHMYGEQADIQTLEGTMIANYGDFIIKGVRGEIYPCKPDIFYETYEKSEDAE